MPLLRERGQSEWNHQAERRNEPIHRELLLQRRIVVHLSSLKDGRTHLAHRAEHAIDLDTGAIVAVTVQDADQGDTTTIQETLPEAAKQLEPVAVVAEDAVAVIDDVGAQHAVVSFPNQSSTYCSRPHRQDDSTVRRTI
ncbi:MAG TPA: hypothetical protein VEL79_20300 [Vicinamibacterales bacterium]|nr:hypothetical protein [Vicinamibacterales bacterium]